MTIWTVIADMQIYDGLVNVRSFRDVESAKKFILECEVFDRKYPTWTYDESDGWEKRCEERHAKRIREHPFSGSDVPYFTANYYVKQSELV